MTATTTTHRPETAGRRRARPVDVRLGLALALALVVHGALLLAGTWQGTYDAPVHIFFADHYAKDWFSTWDTRWYTGFTTTSYPPGAHMLVAAASTVLGLGLAFASVQLGAVLLLVVGSYRSATIWVGSRAAGWAALLTALSSSLAEVVHVFGQLPTTVGLAFTLNALPSAHRWVRDGGGRHLATALACSAAATAAHHVTTLFGAVFFVGPVVVAALLHALREPLAGEATGRPARLRTGDVLDLAARRGRRLLRPFARAAAYGGLLLVVLLGVVLPYWLWSHADPIVQIPIPHASRADFLAEPNAGLVFWLVPWGALLPVLPWALWRGLRRGAWPLVASVALLFVLGLGGTTPVARALTRGAFDILTFDRFTIWATVAVLPLVGDAVDVATRPAARRRLRERLGALAPSLVASMALLGVVAAFLFAATLTRYRPFQPEPIDPDPIAAFLSKDDHDRWRYLALGFGDQIAWLSTRTDATTVDGNYHSARRLPELTTRPVERLEGAKYRGMPGLASLQQFLAVPQRWHLKFAFSNDRFYDPLLHFSGWQRVGQLENGIEVWERPDIAPLPEVLPVRELPAWQRLAWGLLPPTALALAAAALGLQAWRPAGPGGRRPAPGLRRLDARLARRAARLRGPVHAARWQPSLPRRVVVAARALAAARPTPGLVPGDAHRRATAALALGAVALPAVLVGGLLRAPATPEQVVTAWYLALDERRWPDAHALLDPATRPDLASWVLGQSIDGGGLVDSYAKLDGVEVRRLPARGDLVEVEATAAWLTAVTRHDVVTTHRLVRDGRSWAMVPEERDAAVAPEALRRVTGVTYAEGERRSPTTGRTDFSDVQDRPELEVLSSRLVRADDRWVVLGEVANVDVDPAGLTITAVLRDDAGRELTQWNATLHVQHTLLPGESTPFRIEFEGIAGDRAAAELASGSFDPTQWTPPTLPEGAVPTRFDVYARALVTSRDLARPLATQALEVADAPDGIRLTGTIRNQGVHEATLPRALVALRDTDGEVAWVQSVLLDDAVRPQQVTDVDLLVPLPADLEVVRRSGRVLDNGVEDGGPRRAVPSPRVVGHVRSGAVSVDLDAFVREAR